MRQTVLIVILALALVPACNARDSNPISIAGLKEYASTASAEFETVKVREPIGGVNRRVVRFSADNLEQFALLLTPPGEPPASGWPVLLMNHGHHPDPPQYGRIDGGIDDRPGNYYRGLPQAYAEAGFLVVVPDFRGHNDSEGFQYTDGILEASWYPRDSIAAFKALPGLPDADASRVFLWGHSMGGEVTLRMLLALGGQVKAASIWSTVAGDVWEQAVHYSFNDSGVADSSDRENKNISKLQADIAALPFAYSPEQGDPTGFIDQLEVPLIIHHAIGDIWGTPYAWSVELVTALRQNGREYEFFSYPGTDHLFREQQRSDAIERDMQFFKRRME